MSFPLSANRTRRPLALLLCALSGFGAGLLNGLLGAAGGILLVAVLPVLPLPASYLCRSVGNPYRTSRTSPPPTAGSLCNATLHNAGRSRPPPGSRRA